MASFRLTGLCAAPATPFTSDRTVNLKVINEYVDFLIENKMKNAFVLGSCGEGLNLSTSERKMVAEEWIKCAQNKLVTVMQIGATNLPETQELAQHAEQLQVEAIACVSPSYFKPNTEEALIAYLKKVAQAAPKTPLYYYDIEMMTNIKLNMKRFLQLGIQEIPTLAGIKYTTKDLVGVEECVAFANSLQGRSLQILIGCDGLFLPALMIGVEVPVMVPVFGPAFTKLFEAFQMKNEAEARKAMRRVNSVYELFPRYGSFFAIQKAITCMLGIDVGPPRLPITDLSEEEKGSLRADLEAIGFFTWQKSG